MRFLTILMLSLSVVHGQGDVSKILIQGLSGALTALEPVAESDKNVILAATAQVLSKHVTFRPDGTAAAVCTKLSKQHVEWTRLNVRNISKQDVTDADRLNGIFRRFFVSFGCDAHRTFDAKTSRWTEWKDIGYVLFPAGITLELQNDTWKPKSESLDGFSPGPGPSVTARQTTTKDSGLPPGMTRGK